MVNHALTRYSAPIYVSVRPLNAWRLGVVLLLVATLSGCAGMMAYREANQLLAEGKTNEGLAKLEDTVRLESNNVEYRIALASRKAAVVSRELAVADSHRRDGRFLEAERGYNQALRIDANNPTARQGIAAIGAFRKADDAVVEAKEKAKSGRLEDIEASLALLRSALQVSPDHRAALAFKQELDEMRAKRPRTEKRLSAAYRKPITLEFRDAPIKTVFEMIARVSDLNFFFDHDIRPDIVVTILVRNTTIEDAVRTILVMAQLEQSVLNDNSVLIYPSTPQKLKDYKQLSVRSFYVTNADVKLVANSIKTIVKTQDLVIDERLGIIIMRDTPQAIRLAERIVDLQDLTDPEVMLELEVMEVKQTKLLELGVNWPGFLSLTPLSTIGGRTLTLADLRNLRSSSTGVEINSTVINANRELTDGNVLANPRIRVRNKEKAKVLIGERVPVITTTTVATGFVSESISYVDVGLKLNVEPNIHLDQEVAIKVELEVSNLIREISTASGTLAYQIGTRNAATVLRLKDGETQILAGLISDEDRMTANRVPGIGDLPLVGRLFGTQKDDSTRSEVLLSITPRIVRSIRRPEMLAAEFQSGTESRVGAEPLSFASAEGPISPTSPTAAASNRSSAEPLKLSWQIPAQVKAEERFMATLRVETAAALQSLPILLQFDPQLLQLLDIQEGELFKQSAGASRFSRHIDQPQGKAFIAAALAEGTKASSPSAGSVASFHFRALRPQTTPTISILSATPEASGQVVVQDVEPPTVSVIP